MGMPTKGETRKRELAIAAFAAFATYFCMYAFRKPFTAATYDDEVLFGAGLKSTLVISQLAGYMISKFIGIKVVSELNRKYRALAILSLIGLAELALVGFAILPNHLKVLMMFLNGLPLGMIFGFVLSYLEGRQQTEALTAVLCASFIISSGVVKSVGQWLVQDIGVSDFSMPAITGAIFLLPLLVSVWLLEKTPPPGINDVRLRSERKEMKSVDRWRFFNAYRPGLLLLLFVYILLTILRTVRDDFGVELWRDMGVSSRPAVFAQSEIIVAALVTILSATAIFFRNNLDALRAVFVLMCLAFLVTIGSASLQSAGVIGPFGFMIMCGVGLYIPYVAFHTTIFERIVSSSKLPGNLAFLMYLADSIGYLGYALVLAFNDTLRNQPEVLPLFRSTLMIFSVISIACLIVAAFYFHRVLSKETKSSRSPSPSHPL